MQSVRRARQQKANNMSIELIALSFVVGVLLGGYLALRISTERVRVTRSGHWWARSDVTLPAPATVNLRRIMDWQSSPMTDGKSITFSIADRDGIQRDLTYRATTILKFFKCDGPTRAEYHGDHGDYSKLLAIGKHYGWLIPDQGRYVWAAWLATRERRLRILEAWMNA